MATDVIMPALGVAQEKGTLINWRKSEGESVTQGEPLMEVETDKATVEIEAPASGILRNVSAAPGDEVPVGHRIAVILGPGETAAKPSLPPDIGAGADPEGQGTPILSTALPAKEEPLRPQANRSRVIPASPAARRVAREKGIDLAAVRGSGPDGAVLAADVLQSRGAEPEPAGPPRVKETIRLTPMRRIVGERMARSKQTAPHFYLTMDADMTEIARRRRALKEKKDATAPSFNDYILAACARALRKFPAVNASLTADGIQVYSDIHIGMAVALDEGLVVPVVRNADRLSLAELAVSTRALAQKAQNKKLLPLDYEGGTFTVSNLGMFGVDNFVAIVNPPQSAILAVGRVAPRVVSHGEGIAVRSVMTMTLSADHRMIDGAIGARFLAEIRRNLQDGEF